MGAIKPEFPPLLPFGFHPKPLQELRSLLVDGFPQSTRRANLWNNLLDLIDKLRSAGIGCKIWLDGSYLTKKIDPDDIDLIVEVGIHVIERVTPEQHQLLDSIAKLKYHADPMKLHTFVIFTAPFGHIMAPEADRLRARWVKDFGYSLIKGEPKGIAILEVVP
jgi:hypothetical protein